ncbi:MAG: hypothetical protein ACYC56_13445 [Candidatus Aquicultor sp.]
MNELKAQSIKKAVYKKYLIGVLSLAIFAGIGYGVFATNRKNQPDQIKTPASTQNPITNLSPTTSSYSAPTITPSSTATDYSYIFAENLYQYGNLSSPYSAGIRVPNGAKANFYPAAYNFDQNIAPLQIREINMMVGSIKPVKYLQGSINWLVFSTTRQALAYSFEEQIDNQKIVNVAIYDIDNDRETIIHKEQYADRNPLRARWSPDGGSVAFFIANTDANTLTSQRGWLHIYDIAANTTKKIDWPNEVQIEDVTLNNINSTLFFWGDDSQTILGDVNVSSSLYNRQTTAYLLDRKTGQFTFFDDGRLSESKRRFDSPQLLAGKLFAVTRTPYDTTSASEYYGGPGGWLYSYEFSNKLGTDYKEDTGEQIDSNFLMTSDGTKLIYKDLKERQWKYFNTGNKVVTRLDRINEFCQIIGWGGNYDIVLFFNPTHSGGTIIEYDLQMNKISKTIAIP